MRGRDLLAAKTQQHARSGAQRLRSVKWALGRAKKLW